MQSYVRAAINAITPAILILTCYACHNYTAMATQVVSPATILATLIEPAFRVTILAINMLTAFPAMAFATSI